jgi:GWxTD domain-containing protein
MSVAKTCAFLAGLGLCVAPVARAEKMSKESKKWIEEEVAPIVVASEEKAFKDLKEVDRPEFQKIFWARRDPSVDAPKPDNDFKTEYLKRKGEADQRFKAALRAGSLTDCGRAYILIGDPDERRRGERTDGAAGTRTPEIWVYKESPTLKIKGGTLQLHLDEQCQFPEHSGLDEQLRRMAESKITRPGIDYRFGKDGRLTKLADLLPKPTPAAALLKEPRQDFPVGANVQFLKTGDGGTALVGVVHGNSEGSAGQKALKLVVCAQAVGEDGRLAATYEQATVAPVAADGSFSASYRLGLKPGKYTLRVGALEEASKKGSVTELKTDVPDLNTGELTLASLILIREIEDKADGDPAHPFAAYLLGSARLLPVAGATFSKSDSLSIFYQYYDAKVGDATGKASVVASLQVNKGDKPVARAPDAPFEVPVGGNVVGPVPLAGYEPGSYVVKLRVTDNLAKKDATREVGFEVK